MMFLGLESLVSPTATSQGRLITGWNNDIVQVIDRTLKSTDKDILAAWVVSPDSRHQDHLIYVAELLRKIQPISEDIKLYRGIGSNSKAQDFMGFAEQDERTGIRLTDGVTIGHKVKYLNERPLSFSKNPDIAKTYGPVVVSMCVEAHVKTETPSMCLLDFTPELCVVVQRYTSPLADYYCQDEVVLLTTGREQCYCLEMFEKR